MFCREDGSHRDPTVVGRHFARALRETKLPRLRFHDLRHASTVIGLRDVGEWPDETSARLGHSSVAFTLETYGHLLPKRGKAVAVAFDRLFEGPRGRREHIVGDQQHRYQKMLNSTTTASTRSAGRSVR